MDMQPPPIPPKKPAYVVRDNNMAINKLFEEVVFRECLGATPIEIRPALVKHIANSANARFHTNSSYALPLSEALSLHLRLGTMAPEDLTNANQNAPKLAKILKDIVKTVVRNRDQEHTRLHDAILTPAIESAQRALTSNHNTAEIAISRFVQNATSLMRQLHHDSSVRRGLEANSPTMVQEAITAWLANKKGAAQVPQGPVRVDDLESHIEAMQREILPEHPPGELSMMPDAPQKSQPPATVDFAAEIQETRDWLKKKRSPNWADTCRDSSSYPDRER